MAEPSLEEASNNPECNVVAAFYWVLHQLHKRKFIEGGYSLNPKGEEWFIRCREIAGMMSRKVFVRFLVGLERVSPKEAEDIAELAVHAELIERKGERHGQSG
jgi:hypothetical protein